MFPLIPLPIKEAIGAKQVQTILVSHLFPLIPLPIKEAISTNTAPTYGTWCFH